MEPDIESCLARYAKGDAQALDELVRALRRPLYGFILSMVKGPADADDVFQETWARAIRRIKTFDGRNLTAWLFRIARNLVIDRVRRDRFLAPSVVGTGTEGEEFDRIAAHPDPGLDPARRAAGRDIGERIREAVAALPRDQREVFVMRMEADLSFKEIARIQKVPLNTALARMHYAVLKLRAVLGDEYRSWKEEGR